MSSPRVMMTALAMIVVAATATRGQEPLDFADVSFVQSVSLREPTTEQPVYFVDRNLEAAVRQELGITGPDWIYPSDMLGLTELEADHYPGITDLTGLEYATNLTRLSLWANYISGMSALAGMTNLTCLWLHGPVSDISAVAGLTNLTELQLWINRISDLSPIGGLTNLRKLFVIQNSVSDISAVAGLTNLEELILGFNQISDISPLAGLTNLTYVELIGNQITDISAVAGLQNLTVLILHSNLINDISPVAGLTNLTELALAYNQISDISAIAGLTNLRSLHLYYNQVSDISAIADLTNLTWLLLAYNQISDISVLLQQTNLQHLSLYGNPLNRAAYCIYIPIIVDNNPGVNLWNEENPYNCADPVQLLEDVASMVLELNLQNGVSNNLDAKLDAALKAIDDLNENNDVAAINSLEAFISAVEAQRGQHISQDDADYLVAVAQEIIDLLLSE